MASLSMSVILENLHLDCHIENFREEKITPDIVCHLSLYKFNKLGINNVSNVMALQVECTKYGIGAPTSQPATSYPGSLPTPGAAGKTLVAAGHVTL